jgi:hypothetical protein
MMKTQEKMTISLNGKLFRDPVNLKDHHFPASSASRQRPRDDRRNYRSVACGNAEQFSIQ